MNRPGFIDDFHPDAPRFHRLAARASADYFKPIRYRSGTNKP
jgi:hypothetical protein